MIRKIILLVFLSTQLNMAHETKHSNPLKSETPQVEKLTDAPLRVGVIGLVHTHVHWILGRQQQGDIEIVGIVEPNRELAAEYSEQHGYSMDIVYETMEEMVAKTQPQAVTAFNTIYGHLEVVQFCAPRGIHVMVEKPLAVNWEHSQEMLKLAEEHNIHLLTNYESSWYGSNFEAYRRIHEESAIGEIRKIVFHTGHPGPIEIGCNPEFLEWLTDPKLNGGGALTDFGCYGANITTWLMKGAVPLTVSCTVQQIKPDLYPKVEDEATIVLTYPSAQVIIQASWNWPHNVKDMEVYGNEGYIICKNSKDMLQFESGDEDQVSFEAPSLPEGFHDPFALLHQVVVKGYQLPSYDLSGPDNNKIVMQILHAARHSANTGKIIIWNDFFKDKSSE
ncbi:MAG: Gfo/Idh/MocA family oxidoreductase [Flavobacteriaceae bacterium]